MSDIELPPHPSASPEALPPRDPALRRRAWVAVGVCVAVDAFFLVGLWQKWFATGLGAALLAGGLAVSAVVLLAVLEPFRKQELRQNLGNAPAPIGRALLFLLGIMVPAGLVLHFWNDEPWSVSVARPVAVLVYFAVFMGLARQQRRGVPPYLRPAWYGFLLAGQAGALAFIAVAGVDPLEPVVHGITWPLLHYGFVRLNMRGAHRIAQQPAEG